MGADRYLSDGETTWGPYEWTDLRNWWRDGSISDALFLWEPDRAAWTTVREAFSPTARLAAAAPTPPSAVLHPQPASRARRTIGAAFLLAGFLVSLGIWRRFGAPSEAAVPPLSAPIAAASRENPAGPPAVREGGATDAPAGADSAGFDARFEEAIRRANAQARTRRDEAFQDAVGRAREEERNRNWNGSLQIWEAMARAHPGDTEIAARLETARRALAERNAPRGTAGEVRTVTSVAAFLAEHPDAVIDFHADWCGPCREYAPRFARAAAARNRLSFGKVHHETARDEFTRNHVESLPTTIYFRGGVEVDRTIGAYEYNDIMAQLERIFGADE